MLKFVLRSRPRRMSATFGHGSGPTGRLERLRRVVTALVRYERLESYYGRLDEARGYTEKLIQLAIKHGDKDKMAMEMADYWLLEKDLVPKLFKVLAPRYSDYTTSFTQMYMLPTIYPGGGDALGILELKGNPWPSVQSNNGSNKTFLINQLLDSNQDDIELNPRRLSDITLLTNKVENVNIESQENIEPHL